MSPPDRDILVGVGWWIWTSPSLCSGVELGSVCYVFDKADDGGFYQSLRRPRLLQHCSMPRKAIRPRLPYSRLGSDPHLVGFIWMKHGAQYMTTTTICAVTACAPLTRGRVRSVSITGQRISQSMVKKHPPTHTHIHTHCDTHTLL